uniref:Diamine acetyltransferase 2 n=1 Tax=Cacopsylla melanoneura TaxID=428564 RepID=A0A8D8W9N5_9HEMI
MDAITQSGHVIIRPTQKQDCLQIRALIQVPFFPSDLQELANYQQMPDGPKIDAKVLEKHGFDTDSPFFESTVAENTETKKIVGYTIFYYLYDCLEGKYLYLEDICVTEDYRKKGVGAGLFESVVKAGVAKDCSSMRWDVLKWNPARKFYDKYGATNLTESQGVLFHRVYNVQ